MDRVPGEDWLPLPPCCPLYPSTLRPRSRFRHELDELLPGAGLEDVVGLALTAYCGGRAGAVVVARIDLGVVRQGQKLSEEAVEENRIHSSKRNKEKNVCDGIHIS